MSEYDSRRYALVNRWDQSHLKRINRLTHFGPDDRVLEVGCGQGHLTGRLAERGVDVVGIDANPNAPVVSGSDRVLCMNAENLDFADSEFDAIVSVHAIEHIPPLEEAVAEMARVLKPGGRALFIYPAEPIQGLGIREPSRGPGGDAGFRPSDQAGPKRKSNVVSAIARSPGRSGDPGASAPRRRETSPGRGRARPELSTVFAILRAPAWGYSSAGRASEWHSEGQGFEPP